MPSPSDLKTSPAGWNFDNSYACLPETLYARNNPTPCRDPHIVVLNQALAESLGLEPESLKGSQGAALLSGNQLPEGAEPIAQAYAGHQFGYFTMLGDGRAILLGEQVTPTRERFDVQLKGAGQTPFSRRGDGRAALGPMLREYIISEAMVGLGIPTTRSLAVVATGEPVFREQGPLPGAILTRVASSHIRVGTFEYANQAGGEELVKELADYTIQRHYPELVGAENPYLAFLNGVMERQASLIAKWQLVGFIHGVMNTDNMALSGETIDYGPCAFMDTYHPATVFSSIDRQGRYAYSNQPHIAQWNLIRLAETLLPVLHSEPDASLELAKEAVATFPERFKRFWLSGMRSKLGLFTEEPEDASLIDNLLIWIRENQMDYTNTFRALSSPSKQEEPIFQLAGFEEWAASWKARLARQAESFSDVQNLMNAHNPAVIPRNYRVEEALAAAIDGDLGVMQRLLEVLKTPYGDSDSRREYTFPPEPGAPAYQTFCGT